MQRPLVWARAVLFVAGAIAGAAQELSEKEVVALFRAQGPAVGVVRARKALAEAEARTRGLYSNPNAQYSREGAGFTEFWQLEQALPLAGRQKAQRAAAAGAVRVVEAEGAAALWQAELNLRSQFLRVLVNQEREAVLKRAMGTVRGVASQLSDREREGEGSKYDRLRAEREAAGIEAELRVAEAETMLSRAGVRAFLPEGIAWDRASGSLAERPLEANAKALLARALAHREDYQAERRRAEQFALEAAAAARLRYPDPVAHAGLKRADVSAPGAVSTANGVSFGVSVPLPVFQNGRQEVARYQAEGEQVKARLAVLERQIAASIEGLLETYAGRRRAREGFDAQVREAGAELVRIARVAYEEGEINVLALLDAYRSQWQAELRSLELAAAVREVHLELERTVGEEVGQ